jgi:hypothetical protein
LSHQTSPPHPSILKTSTSDLPPADSERITEILAILKEVQLEVANVKQRILALELSDQRMTKIERHLFGDKVPDKLFVPPDPTSSNQSVDMALDHNDVLPQHRQLPSSFSHTTTSALNISNYTPSPHLISNSNDNSNPSSPSLFQPTASFGTITPPRIEARDQEVKSIYSTQASIESKLDSITSHLSGYLNFNSKNTDPSSTSAGVSSPSN